MPRSASATAARRSAPSPGLACLRILVTSSVPHIQATVRHMDEAGRVDGIGYRRENASHHYLADAMAALLALGILGLATPGAQVAGLHRAERAVLIAHHADGCHGDVRNDAEARSELFLHGRRRRR